MIERIHAMEQRLNRAAAAVKAMEDALDAYEAAQDDLRILGAYYESDRWMLDYEAEDTLPPGMPRGVLSEDGIYDLLERNDELRARIAGELGCPRPGPAD